MTAHKLTLSATTPLGTKSLEHLSRTLSFWESEDGGRIALPIDMRRKVNQKSPFSQT